MSHIGIDMGGTKIAGALFDDNNNIIVSTKEFINGKEGESVAKMVIDQCIWLMESNGININSSIKIGVSVPGIAYSSTGVVWAPNIKGWDSFPLKEHLIRAFPSAMIAIESDRTCYIMGEIMNGAAKGCTNAIFMAVGTGIGAGIVVDGKILHGHSDIVGAIGWMALRSPQKSGHSNIGCFEGYASGEGILSQAKNQITSRHPAKGILSQTDPNRLTTAMVFDAYFKGDPIAKFVIGRAIEMWGMASANLVSLFNPSVLIFGGGVFGPAAELIEDIYKEACNWAQPMSIKQVKFIQTSLPHEAGLYGAGAISITNCNN